MRKVGQLVFLGLYTDLLAIRMSFGVLLLY